MRPGFAKPPRGRLYGTYATNGSLPDVAARRQGCSPLTANRELLTVNC